MKRIKHLMFLFPILGMMAPTAYVYGADQAAVSGNSKEARLAAESVYSNYKGEGVLGAEVNDKIMNLRITQNLYSRLSSESADAKMLMNKIQSALDLYVRSKYNIFMPDGETRYFLENGSQVLTVKIVNHQLQITK